MGAILPAITSFARELVTVRVMFTVLRATLREPEGGSSWSGRSPRSWSGTLVFRWLEGWSIVDSLDFSVMTLATVGYGDLHPPTDAAKLFAVVCILFGLGVLAAFISELTKHRAAIIARLRP